MSSGGRKKDGVWDNFIQRIQEDKKGSRAVCKECGQEMQGLVVRMKQHLSVCRSKTANQGDEAAAAGVGEPEEKSNRRSMDVPSDEGDADAAFNPPPDKKAKSSTSSIGTANSNTSKPKRNTGSAVASVSNFVIRTTNQQKDNLDEQVAKFIYATNSPFSLADHPEFVKLCEMLRPGYIPPNRDKIGGPLLDRLYQKQKITVAAALEGKTVSLDLDGWSNVHNEPIVCASVNSDGLSYLVETIETTGSPHTAEYLQDVAVDTIKKCKREFGCDVRSCVTDNAANVAKMRSELEKMENEDPDLNVIAYGCAAHLLNLLAKDLDIPGVKNHVVEVVKYFRNTHFAAALYKASGVTKIPLPQDVRWNTLCDCLEGYITHWPVLARICEENREKIDKDISSKVLNMGMKRNAEELLKRLKCVAVALDAMQRDSTTIADAVAIWKKMAKAITSLNPPKHVLTALSKRESQALTPAHFFANILHPVYQGEHLTASELNEAMKWASTKYPNVIQDVINFRAHALPFQEYMFSESTIKNVKPVVWWKSQEKQIGGEIINAAVQVLSAVASSAGVERVFSSFGLVQSKLRNRLGNEKAGKLVFLYRSMNLK